jgi:hypothetical protein
MPGWESDMIAQLLLRLVRLGHLALHKGTLGPTGNDRRLRRISDLPTATEPRTVGSSLWPPVPACGFPDGAVVRCGGSHQAQIRAVRALRAEERGCYSPPI